MTSRIIGIVDKSERAGYGCNITVTLEREKKSKDAPMPSSRSGKQLIHCPFFCNTRPGDSIKGKVKKSGSKWTFTEQPFIDIPSDKASIIQAIYLTMKGVPGMAIGETRARAVYDTLKSNARTLEINSDEVTGFSSVSVYLSELSDKNDILPLLVVLSETQAKILLNKWKSQRDLRRLYCLGLNKMEINKARSSFNALYKDLIVNPFAIAVISLDKAMDIANKLEMEITPEHKLCGSILRKVYDNAQSNGWTYTPITKIMRDFPDFNKVEALLIQDYKILITDAGVYLKQNYDDLYTILNFIQKTIGYDITPPVCTIVKRDDTKHKPTEEQSIAIRGALENPFSVITGGPGRGKTTCIKNLVDELEGRGRKPIIMTPIGKAASRVAKATSIPASTIHRAINDMQNGTLGRFDHIIVDEASTMSSELFAMLIEQLNTYETNFTMTLVGDVNQLPPIGPGLPFEAIIRSDKVPTYTLTVNLRICEGVNGIEENANMIKECALLNFVESDNFTVIDGDLETVEDVVLVFKDQEYDLQSFQIISPYKNGPSKKSDFDNKDKVSVGPLRYLNDVVQRIYNKKARKIEEPFSRPGQTPLLFKVGDKVMANANNYDIKIFNGDDGVITAVNEAGIMVDFGIDPLEKIKKSAPKPIIKIKDMPMVSRRNHLGESLITNERRIIEFPFVELSEDYSDKSKLVTNGNRPFTLISSEEETDKISTRMIDPAYAISGHKSQGNEYDHVIVVLSKDRAHTSFLHNRLLYTMITRAKRSVWIVGNIEVLEQAGRTPMPNRYDELEDLLKILLDNNVDINEETIEGDIEALNEQINSSLSEYMGSGYELPPDMF